jgi:hypothetical protein
MQVNRTHENPLKFNRHRSASSLTFYVVPFRFEFRISGPISSRGRRTILLMVFRKIREIFGELKDAEINHERPDYMAMLFPPRPLSLRETPRLNSPCARAGYSLRLMRHRNRLSLREVSELSGINIGHLSDLERGKHVPTRETVLRIKTALAKFEKEGIICLSTNRTEHPKKIRKMP